MHELRRRVIGVVLGECRSPFSLSMSAGEPDCVASKRTLPNRLRQRMEHLKKWAARSAFQERKFVQTC